MTTAAERKRVREEERREAIAASNTLTRITKLIDQLESIGASDENVHAAKVGALKGALDARLRLLDKYVPSLKAQEIQATVQASHEDMLAKLDDGGA